MKYRVWCKYINSWELDDCFIAPSGDLYIHKHNTFMCLPQPHHDHIVEIDTGLVDRNDEPIYVGDIVRYEDGNCGYGRLRDYYLDGYMYEVISPDNYFYQLYYYFNTHNKTSVEKIGNIHETKITDAIRYWIDDEFREKFQKEHGKPGQSW